MSPDSLQAACAKAGVSSIVIEKLLSGIDMTEYKEKLKACTQEALDLGVGDYGIFAVLIYRCSSLQAFGAPFIVVDVKGKKERFFGSDRFELIGHIIGMKYE